MQKEVEINEKYLNNNELIANSTWPTNVEVEKLEQDRIVMVQVNGKIRGKLVNPSLSDSPTEAEMLQVGKEVAPNFVNDENFKKAIFIKGKMISIATEKEEE